MFRLNFSHIKDPQTQTPIIEDIRRHSKELGIPVAILGITRFKLKVQVSKNAEI